MNISIDELSKDEYRKLFSVMDISPLRALIVSDNKLIKKYIRGYRPEKTPATELARIYQAEITNGNNGLRDAFVATLTSWVNSIIATDTVGDEASPISISEAVNIGLTLAKEELHIEFDLFAKVVSWDCSFQQVQVIKLVYESVSPIIAEQKAALDKLQAQLHEMSSSSHANEDRIKKLQDSRDKYKESADEEKRKKEDLEIELENTNGELQDLKSRIAELEEELQSKQEQIEFLRADIKKKEVQLKESNQTITAVNTEKNVIIAEKKKLEAQRDFEFEQLIQHLVTETISDLKLDFELSREEFDKIVENVDGPHDIANVWGNMSQANMGMIEDIEANMKRNVASMEIIDMCDQAENYILVKYIILKAIKAIVFEKMSRKEKNEPISSSFSTK